MDLKPMEYKQVIVVRKDIHMSKGFVAEQVATASLNAVVNAQAWWPKICKKWMNEGQNITNGGGMRGAHRP